MKKLYFVALMVLLTSLVCGQRKYATATIDSGVATTAGVVIPVGYWLSQIDFPTLTTGTASYSFTVGANDRELWYDGAKVTTTIKASGLCLDAPVPAKVMNVETFKVVLDSVQTADRTLTYTYEKKKSD